MNTSSGLLEKILKEQVNVNKVREMIMVEYAKADQEFYEVSGNQKLRYNPKFKTAREKLQLLQRLLLELTKLEKSEKH